MPYQTIEEWICEEHGHRPSVDDQVLVADWFYRNGITSADGETRRTSEIEDALAAHVDHQVGQILENLEALGILEKTEPTTRRFILNERTGKSYWTPDHEDLPASLHTEMARLIYDLHLREGRDETPTYPDPLQPPTLQSTLADGGELPINPSASGDLRTFVASVLEVDPEYVEEALVEPMDLIDRMNQFAEIVEEIKQSEEAEELERGLAYGRVGWLNQANKWSLSGRAKRIEDNASITE